ncbi:TIR domain-containing protein [Cryptosporangium phraense]|uniref:TIR domain-containing protein n=1 Tax=Cryptosporangium phraense TaxID=2593070 RepID=A0A545AU34_9ACTN|nr:TIR domain-containing protein [Cryptosporangium phraense]TQS44859.1 TIR domain-containing protein [Cryptosporangium phraense]
MALPRAFISFDFDNDRVAKHLFAGQATSKSPTPFATEDWSSKGALPQREWERLIRAKINRCHLVIVLVGRQAASASGVVKEIQMARDLGIPYFGVYVSGADARTPLPRGLARNAVVPWTWPTVARMVDDCLRARRGVRPGSPVS